MRTFIDGTTQDTYGKYRIGGKLDKVLAGTKAIMEAKNSLILNTSCDMAIYSIFT
ncbi:MAG: hypothetical protein R2852_00225 [Bacteroidia bacterium]